MSHYKVQGLLFTIIGTKVKAVTCCQQGVKGCLKRHFGT